MNREILFRGKGISTQQTFRQYSDKWIEGYYLQCSNRKNIDLPDEHNIVIKNGGLIVEINPETIGQYTGLNDRNGNRIFEGDIYKVANKLIYTVEYVVKGESYNDKIGACFGLRLVSNNEVLIVFDEFAIDEGEVIGNTTDNPEMLTNNTKELSITDIAQSLS